MQETRFDWENPAVIQRHKEDGHVIAFSYTDAKDAAARKAPDTKFSLNGNWKFHWQRGLQEEPSDFFLPNFDDSAWRVIEKQGKNPVHRPQYAGNQPLPPHFHASRKF